MRIRSLLRVAALLTGTLLSAGCAMERKAWFDPAEYEKFHASGTGRVEGQAFCRTRGGDVKYAAGLEIWLNPVTTYSQEWYDRTYLQGTRLGPPDPRLIQEIRITRGDGEGRFSFEEVPPGEYFATTVITWQFGPSAFDTSTGVCCGRVTVKDGETTRAIVTR